MILNTKLQNTYCFEVVVETFFITHKINAIFTTYFR